MTHDELIELIPLLAIDALTDAERATVRAHVATCSSCTALLQDYQRVADGLLEHTPSTAWIPNLEPRLRERVRALPQSVPSRVMRDAPRPRRWWQQPIVLPRWLGLGAAFVGIVLLALTLWSWWSLQTGQGVLSNEREYVEIVKLLDTPGTVGVRLRGTERNPTASGYALLNANSTRAYLFVHDLSELPADQVYQVWLNRDSERDSAGTFTVDTQGHAAVHIWASKPWNTYQEISVTQESGRGNNEPSMLRLLSGTIRP